ncbi:hypothetical protein SeMB42_g06647 [Synchytrium endobioticum]|nr:hypothetical protein SeMB42_g06647 [Synchytrium endobioticum]
MPVQAPIPIQPDEEAFTSDDKKFLITKLHQASSGITRPILSLRKPTQTQYNSIGSLYPGSRFTGEQKSGRSTYSVSVEIQHVDLRESFLCGYLNIKGLTEDWPELCTFFEAEIIGPRYAFLTRKWDADEAVDRQHWMKFPAFAPCNRFFNEDRFVYDFEKQDVVFMRWKEHFLVPDHRIKSISGASFAGFYYIAYQKSTGVITGFYFHTKSEWFQQVQLAHIPDMFFPSFEFR